MPWPAPVAASLNSNTALRPARRRARKLPTVTPPSFGAALLRRRLRLRRQAMYLLVHGRRANLDTPQLFTEKVVWRILNDRRDMLVGTCDKLAMKDIARGAAPEVRVPQTYWSGVDLRELAEVELPDRWVLKPTHRSGRFLDGHGRPDLAALPQQTKGWLREVNWSVHGEWAYSKAVPQFLVEERIGTTDALPADYKFFVFDGVPRYVSVIADRAGTEAVGFYTTDWRFTASRADKPEPDRVPPPPQLEEMLGIAAKVAAGYDFLRVDLYNTGGQVWFGETTPYPSSGFAKYQPAGFDLELGRCWTLPPL